MCIIASGERLILRDRLPSDVDIYVRWPWDGVYVTLTKEEEEEIRQAFLERFPQSPPSPRARAIIATVEGEPLGWVTRYVNERFPDAWFVGIDICEDAYLNRGFGTEALGLWIDYLFSSSDVHRIGLDTWSFNARMTRVAEKLGLVYEGAQRSLIKWHGERLDLLHFGILRGEWGKGP